jgi:predicted nucleic acid-binding protein
LVRVVIDANVVFAALKDPAGSTAAGIKADHAHFIAPDWLLQEVGRFHGILLQRASITQSELDHRIEVLLRDVRLVPKSLWEPHSQHPFVRAVTSIDPKDGPYAACFVAARADFLWTRDRKLRAVLASAAVRSWPEPTWRSC